MDLNGALVVGEVNQTNANRREWCEQDFRRSVDFHAVLLAMASHDLRQHLQTILNTYSWLSRHGTSGAEREQIERGQDAVAQMAEQLRQLTIALRMNQQTGRVDVAPVSLGPLFFTFARDASESALRRGVQLRVVPTHEVVESDPILLGSVIGNLMQNALKFTAPGGRVLLGCRRRGSFVRIEIHDTGIGIPSGHRRKIFEAFHRLNPTQSDGIGLGLFIVSRAVELLQHRIEVQSAVGRGSCFTIFANAWN